MSLLPINEPARNLSDSLSVRIEEATIRAAVGDGLHFSFVIIYDSGSAAVSGPIFDPHTWNGPFVVEIYNESYFHLTTTL